MVTWYEFALWVHMFGAVIWVGGGIAIQFFAIRIMRTNDPIRLAGFAKDAEWASAPGSSYPSRSSC